MIRHYHSYGAAVADQQNAPPDAGALLHELFERQARRSPTAAALIHGDAQLSYADVSERVARVAERLAEMGARPGDRVALCVDRSLELVIGILGILKAGAAYVPLDPRQPADRLAFQMEDVQASALLTTEETYREVFGRPLADAQTCAGGSNRLCGPRVASLRAILATDARPRFDAEPPRLPAAKADDLAYILYTSGSTGKPKGVMITHQAAVNTVSDVNSRFDIRPTDRVLALSSPCFDLSVYDLFGLLAVGGAVVIPRGDRAQDPAHWAELIVRHRVTVWNTVPALMEMMVDYSEQHAAPLDTLERVLLSGDWIGLSLPDRVRARAPRAEVIGLGGVTEASIWSTYFRIGQVRPEWKSIPYGRALANQTVQVLDEALRPCDLGATGQIYIGGAGVAEGYWNRPELTAARFLDDPRDDRPGAKLYATGDLGRYMPDGEIEFLGRADTQVKVNGFRVELEEIEAALARRPEVAQAVVALRRGASAQLCAFVVLRTGASPTEAGLADQLRQELPEYMVPGQFVFKERLPLNVNGKVDRAALAHEAPSRSSSADFLGPCDPLQMRLAQIWEQVLRVSRIDVREDFFALGGNSLAATLVVSRVAAELGVRLSPRTLLEASTIEQLATLVEQAGPAKAADPLVVLQRGVGPALFCVPCVFGSLWEFRKLAGRLDPGLLVYGLQPRGMDGVTSAFDRIEPLVDYYLGETRSAQPHGPYLLAGFSFGGAVAFEMARRLIADGEEVRLLALLDAPARGHGRLTRAVQNAAQQAGQALARLGAKRPRGVAQRLARLLLRPGVEAAAEAFERNPPLRQVFMASRRALDRYRPRPLATKADLFWATEHDTWLRRIFGDKRRRWLKLAEHGCVVHEMPCGHGDFFSDRPVGILAEQLREAIKAATR